MVLEFDLSLKTVPVKLGDNEYELREASGEAAKKFSNARLARIKFSGGKADGLHDLGDLEPLLVSLCLFDLKTGKNIPQAVVETWPGRVVTALFNEAKKISGLEETNVTVSKLLKKALNHEESPVSYEDLTFWVESLDEEEYRPLLLFLKEESELKK